MIEGTPKGRLRLCTCSVPTFVLSVLCLLLALLLLLSSSSHEEVKSNAEPLVLIGVVDDETSSPKYQTPSDQSDHEALDVAPFILSPPAGPPAQPEDEPTFVWNPKTVQRLLALFSIKSSAVEQLQWPRCATSRPKEELLRKKNNCREPPLDSDDNDDGISANQIDVDWLYAPQSDSDERNFFAFRPGAVEMFGLPTRVEEADDDTAIGVTGNNTSVNIKNNSSSLLSSTSSQTTHSPEGTTVVDDKDNGNETIPHEGPSAPSLTSTETKCRIPFYGVPAVQTQTMFHNLRRMVNSLRRSDTTELQLKKKASSSSSSSSPSLIMIDTFAIVINNPKRLVGVNNKAETHNGRKSNSNSAPWGPMAMRRLIRSILEIASRVVVVVGHGDMYDGHAVSLNRLLRLHRAQQQSSAVVFSLLLSDRRGSSRGSSRGSMEGRRTRISQNQISLFQTFLTKAMDPRFTPLPFASTPTTQRRFDSWVMLVNADVWFPEGSRWSLRPWALWMSAHSPIITEEEEGNGQNGSNASSPISTRRSSSGWHGLPKPGIFHSVLLHKAASYNLIVATLSSFQRNIYNSGGRGEAARSTHLLHGVSGFDENCFPGISEDVDMLAQVAARYPHGADLTLRNMFACHPPLSGLHAMESKRACLMRCNKAATIDFYTKRKLGWLNWQRVGDRKSSLLRRRNDTTASVKNMSNDLSIPPEDESTPQIDFTLPEEPPSLTTTISGLERSSPLIKSVSSKDQPAPAPLAIDWPLRHTQLAILNGTHPIVKLCGCLQVNRGRGTAQLMGPIAELFHADPQFHPSLLVDVLRENFDFERMAWSEGFLSKLPVQVRKIPKARKK